MAAYAALLSLKPKINHHLYEHPGHLRIPISTEFHIMKDALEEIGNTLQVLQILDSGCYISEKDRVRTWDLVESHMSKQFPCEYPMVQFAVKDVEPLVELIRRTRVDGSVIERIRDEAVCGLEHVLQSLVSSLPLNQLLAELNRAKQQIDSFIKTVKKIEDGGKKSKNMVRLHDEFPKISKDLLPGLTKRWNKLLTDLEVTVRSLDMRRSNSSRERMNGLELQIRDTVCEHIAPKLV